MFHHVSVARYKGFREAQFKIRPLTILMGRNSSGKTSFLNLLLGMQQSAQTRKNPRQFIHNGDNVSFGPAENFWFGKDTSEPVTLDFSFRSDELRKKVSSSLLNEFQNSLYRAADLYANLPMEMGESTHDSVFTQAYSELVMKQHRLRSAVAASQGDGFDAGIIDPLSTFHALLQKYASRGSENSIFVSGLSKQSSLIRRHELGSATELNSIHEWLTDMSKSEYSADFTVRYELRKTPDSRILVKHLTVLHERVQILSIEFSEDQSAPPVKNICSDVTDVTLGSFAASVKMGSPFATFIDLFDDLYRRTELFEFLKISSVIREIFHVAQNACFENKMSSSGFSHVPPLRSQPRRYYLPEQLNPTPDQVVMFEGLESRPTRDAINKWLHEFEISISVDKLEEVIKKIMFRPSNSELTLEIADVGFGYSQIIPVLSSLMTTRSRSLSLIEQPEVHLHPDMQAACGSLFVDLILAARQEGEERCIIVETHSEYLLTEVRARIAKNEISAEDVSVVYFSQEQGENLVQEAEISPEGAIYWPKKFIDRHLRNQRSLIARQIESSNQ